MSTAPKEQQNVPTLELVPPIDPRFVETQRLDLDNTTDPFYTVAFAVTACMFIWFGLEFTLILANSGFGF